MIKEFRSFLATLKPMTWRQRAEHIWEYYKPHMIIGMIVIILTVACFSMYQNARIPILYSGLLANIQPSEEGWSYLETGYWTHIGGAQDEKIHISLVYFEDIYSMEGLSKGYNAAVSGVAMVSGGTVDYILCDQEALEFYLTQDVLMDLREFLTPDQLQQLDSENKLIYLQHEDSQTAVPMAVCIDDMPFTASCLQAEKPIYFTLAANTDQLEQCHDFWEYLWEWE